MPARKKTKIGIKKTDMPECGACPAACCHDLTIPITKPRTIADIDVLKWQMNYDTVAVYVRNKRWYMLVKGRCMYLDEKDLCTRYAERFDICRDHKPPYCEWFDDWYDYMFTDPEELDAFLTAQRRGKKPKMPTGQWTSKGSGRHPKGRKKG